MKKTKKTKVRAHNHLGSLSSEFLAPSKPKFPFLWTEDRGGEGGGRRDQMQSAMAIAMLRSEERRIEANRKNRKQRKKQKKRRNEINEKGTKIEKKTLLTPTPDPSKAKYEIQKSTPPRDVRTSSAVIQYTDSNGMS